MNCNGHSSPVKHKVQGKPHKILEKLKITSGKSTLFGHFFVKYFRSPVFTSIFLLIQMILPLCFTHVWLCVDLVFALLLWFWAFQVKKKKKTRMKSWFQGNVNFFENLIFNPFYDSYRFFLIGIYHIKGP